MGSAALPPSKRGRCIRPLTRASAALRYPTERSELDFREELADGFTCAMNRYKREERQGRDTVQCLSEISHDDIVQELVHESHYSICTFKIHLQIFKAMHSHRRDLLKGSCLVQLEAPPWPCLA
ncbi:uncharacterized protein [Desmodus rotundus]|uniref:uncharacterized protein isoform X3 n=1 Tax=Desmodus rotundus TaxID=9430 RepID=UPI0039E6BBE0